MKKKFNETRKTYPLTPIKIDQSFAQVIQHSKRDASVVRAIKAIA